MASRVQFLSELINKSLLLNRVHLARASSQLFIQTRGAQYANRYLEPTLDKTELAQPLAEDDVRKFQPIKAAKTIEHTLWKYDPIIEKFICVVMEHGRKQLARELVEKAFTNVKRLQLEKYHKSPPEERDKIVLDPVKVFHMAVENCKPVLILTKVVKGGVTYQVPIPCKPNYQRFKSMKWLIESSMEKDRQTRFYDKLAWELIEASKNEGKSIRKKQELHKQCEANRAYAHFRW